MTALETSTSEAPTVIDSSVAAVGDGYTIRLPDGTEHHLPREVAFAAHLVVRATSWSAAERARCSSIIRATMHKDGQVLVRTGAGTEHFVGPAVAAALHRALA